LQQFFCADRKGLPLVGVQRSFLRVTIVGREIETQQHNCQREKFKKISRDNLLSCKETTALFVSVPLAKRVDAKFG